MQRLPPNSRRAREDLWETLDERIERAERDIIEPVRERLEREIELRDVVDRWDDGDLLNPQFPMTMDVFVVGFSDRRARRLMRRLTALGLRCDDAPDNAAALATMEAYHTRALLWNATRPAPGSFYSLATARQPHLKGIAVGDPSNEVVFQRLRNNSVSTFIPEAITRADASNAPAFDQCVLATLARRAPICANFAEGSPCRGECAHFEGPQPSAASGRAPIAFKPPGLPSR